MRSRSSASRFPNVLACSLPNKKRSQNLFELLCRLLSSSHTNGLELCPEVDANHLKRQTHLKIVTLTEQGSYSEAAVIDKIFFDRTARRVQFAMHLSCG